MFVAALTMLWGCHLLIELGSANHDELVEWLLSQSKYRPKKDIFCVKWGILVCINNYLIWFDSLIYSHSRVCSDKVIF